MKHFNQLSTLILITFCFAACQNKPGEVVDVNPAFTQFVSAYTSGVISVIAPITIQLSEDNPKAEVNSYVSAQLLKFEPEIAGQAIWQDQRTIEFRPSERMKSATQYLAEFKLGDLVETPSDLSVMQFNFQTKVQDVQVSMDGLSYDDPEKLEAPSISGRVRTADHMRMEDLQAALSATQSGKELELVWDELSSEEFAFTIQNAERKKTRSEIFVSWKGAELELAQNGETLFELPPLGDMHVISCKMHHKPSRFLEVQFTDPIDRKQDIEGLVQLRPHANFRTEVRSNSILLFPTSKLSGTRQVIVDQAIRNTKGYEMQASYTTSITFNDLKPAVEFINTGTILPSTNGMTVPIRAVNLSAVSVKVIKVFEENVPQFLQRNDLDGNNEITRVGQLVLHKEIPLEGDGPIDLGSWNNFALDLSEMMNTEPGAIYRIELDYDRSQSLYACESSDEEIDKIEYMSAEDLKPFEGPRNYYGGRYYSYNWRDRENPCTDSYYNYKRGSISKNLLASDLGLIAKGNDANEYLFSVSDLGTSKALSGVDLSVFDYQGQLIKEIRSDADGNVSTQLQRKPFLLIAKKGQQRGYLRLDDGLALSTSMFNVGGQKLVKGIKGFLYGERGVWRPGDTLNLNFILNDPQKALPADHPVVFELFTPQGQLHERLVRNRGVKGFYDLAVKTHDDSPTGNWLGKVKVGGSTFTKNLKIETVKPNRLKIRTDLSDDAVLKGTEDIHMNVTWLHGAVAKGLKTDVSMTVRSGSTRFKDYPDHTFDDPAKEFSSEEQIIFDGQIDQNGKATYRADISVGSSAPGMLDAAFRTRVFEKGGDISEDRVVHKYSPFAGYVGVKVPKGKGWRDALYSNEKNIFSVVTVDEDGKKVDRKGLIVEIFDVRWRWWWEYEDRYDLARYVANSSSHRIQVDTLNTRNGEARYELFFGDSRWGRKLIRVTDPNTGHSTGQVFYMSYSGWWDDPDNNPGGAEMLSFRTDKEKYKPGETAKIILPEMQDGRVMVSIESGSRVIENFWVNASDSKNVSFTVSEEMTPNVYVNVALVQAHAQVANDLPIRLYGINQIKVEDPATRLEPVVNMPAEIRPETDFTVSVNEKNGKPMTYTIAVVDEGLLDLTRFKTPDPWNRFFQREALGVRTWDMYKHVIGAFSGEMAGLLAIGGDESLENEVQKKAQRFVPVVRCIGPFELKAGEKAVHKLDMPNYVGSVRTMVIAGNGKAFGHSEATTPVRKPLMVLATLPRVVGPGEKLDLPVTVFAMDKKIKDVQVKVISNEFLLTDEANQQSITFDEVGDQLVNFPLRVAEKPGIGKLTVEVSSGGETARHEIEIDVRLANPAINEMARAMVRPGESWTGDYAPVGIAGTNNGVLTLSSVPPMDLEGRMKYLVRYPHGCIEQTTSSAFPQLYLSDLMEMDSDRKSEIQRNIMAALNRLRSFQSGTGGMHYWPGSGEISEWGTNYAGHFMLEAKEKGYALPVGMINDWTRYQKEQANNWVPSANSYTGSRSASMNTQSYRLFTLALAGKPAKGAMNRMREIRDLSTQARWRLAAAYQLISRSEVAKELVARASTEIKPYREMAYTYGSDLRDQAMILETLAVLKDDQRGKAVLDDICEALRSRSWHSTQTTAYSLLAVSKFLAGTGAGESSLNYALNLKGKSSSNTSDKYMAQHEIGQSDNSGKIMVENKGSKTLFVEVVRSGVPLTGDKTSSFNELNMEVSYYNMNDQPINPSCIDQGTDFYAEVKITNPGNRGNYKEMALTQIFPSGWEIRNTRMESIQSPVKADTPEYCDIRDDRVYSYFDLGRGQTVRYRTILNAAYLGNYYLPTVYCEAMYDNDINARVAGQWIDVSPVGAH